MGFLMGRVIIYQQVMLILENRAGYFLMNARLNHKCRLRRKGGKWAAFLQAVRNYGPESL